MSSDFFQDTDGHTWWVDVDAITIMLRQWAQAQAYVDNFSVTESNGLRELQFDQSGFRRARERLHQQEMGQVSQNIYTAPNEVRSQLIRRYQEIPRLEQRKRQFFTQVQAHNSQTISRRVTNAQRTVTALRFTRDISAAIFMCCIPASGLGAGAAMLARLGGSVFQGVATYQDTGNAAAAFASGALSFKSSLMALPEGAGRVAQVVFNIVNTGNTAVANSAVRMMTVPRGSASTFTNVLRVELITGGAGAATGPMLDAINDRIAGNVLPVVVSVAGDQATSYASGQVASATQPSSGTQSSGTQVRDRLRQQSRAQTDALWESTPFYQYMATGDPNALLSRAEQHVMGTMLRRGE